MKDGSKGDDLSDDGAPAPLNENQPIDPLVLDLDGDGVELTGQAPGTTAYFDLDADGFAERTGWVKADDGLLALDRNGNNTIDTINELFGNATTDGFTKLAELDSNGDRVIDARDARFAELTVWQDRDQDGVSDAGELKSLSELGIASISLNAARVSITDQGNVISHSSTFQWSDGHSGKIAAVSFDNDQIDTRFRGTVSLDDRFLFLPQLRGYGEVAPLTVAMSQDETLLSMVADLTFAGISGAAGFRDRIEAILLRWAGADGVDPVSRGVYVDARHLAALERFTGETFTDGSGAINPRFSAQGQFVESIWQDFVAKQAARLLIQGPLADVAPGLRYNPMSGRLYGQVDLTDAFHRLFEDGPAAIASDATSEEWRSALSHWKGIVTVVDLFSTSLNLDPSSLDASVTAELAARGLPMSASELRHAIITNGATGRSANDILLGGSWCGRTRRRRRK